MVAIRRAPGPPPQFNSEDSDSSVTALSSSKAKTLHQASHPPEQSSPLANGKSREDPHDSLREDGSRDTGAPRAKKNKGGRKAKNGGKKRKNKKANLTEVLSRYLLLFFTIYFLSACPGDAELKSPVCRGLSEYRRLILEPYIFPVVNKALSHPSILPYVDRAKPFANQAIQITRPVVSRTQLEWNHRIVPQWNKVIVPQYHKYLTPQLERASAVIRPYLSIVEEQYESLLAPPIRVIFTTINKCQRAARPYILIAADKTYSCYQTTRPYLRPLWQRIVHILKQLLTFLRAQRRQFVDPHVAKIWARVKELSRGGDETVTVQSTLVHSISSAAVETPFDSPMVQGLSTKPDEVEPTFSDTENSAGSSPLSSLASETTLISTPKSRSLQHDGVTQEVVSEVLPSTRSSPVESLRMKAHTSSAVESTPLPTTAISSTPAVSQSLDEGVNLEAFYADIGLDDEEPEAEVPEEDTHTKPPPLTEEQAEELRLKELAKTAEKRRDIMSRHTKWEEKLDNMIKEKKKALRKALVAMRKAAVQELETNSDVQSAIDQLVENAEKFLKGAEAYLNNVKAESQLGEEKAALWTKVLAKVDTKFTEHLRNTEDVVNGWYTTHLGKELQEVRQATEAVSDLADKAQADVGYDYIWLADVTYLDWQRYHALVGRSNNFTELAQSIQNGSHPSPPIDPISDALYELQLGLQDVIEDFETRLRRIKRNGLKIFDSLPEDTMAEEEMEDGAETPMPPEVSILPIAGDEPDPATPNLGSELPVVGRGKVEVEDAFARADAALDGERSQRPDHSTVDGSSEAESILVTPTVVPPPMSSLHEEL